MRFLCYCSTNFERQAKRVCDLKQFHKKYTTHEKCEAYAVGSQQQKIVDLLSESCEQFLAFGAILHRNRGVTAVAPVRGESPRFQPAFFARLDSPSDAVAFGVAEAGFYAIGLAFIVVPEASSDAGMLLIPGAASFCLVDAV